MNVACPTGHRLPPCPTELELGIFEAAYGSVVQRRRRTLAIALLAAKHTLRGLAFSWPAYVLALAAFSSERVGHWAWLVLLIPALAVSFVILTRGVRDDYRDRVKDVLLGADFVRALLFPAAP